MIQIDFAAVRDVGRRPKGLMLTLVINWLIKLFAMAALGWLFFEGIFYWVPHVASENLHHAIGIRWVFYGEFVLLINMWDNQSIDIQILNDNLYSI